MNNKTVIHTETQEQWDTVIEYYEMNFPSNGWDTNKVETCINMSTQGFRTKRCYESEGHIILPFDKWRADHPVKDHIVEANKKIDHPAEEDELLPCPVCKCIKITTYQNIMRAECDYCNFNCDIEDWNKIPRQPALSELERQWMERGPNFKECDGQTDILVGEEAQKGDHYWDSYQRTWEPASVGAVYDAICRPKQPEFRVEKTESEAILLKDGQEIESMPLEHYAEWVKLIVPSESGK